jgi:hypothetical protein
MIIYTQENVVVVRFELTEEVRVSLRGSLD